MKFNKKWAQSKVFPFHLNASAGYRKEGAELHLLISSNCIRSPYLFSPVAAAYHRGMLMGGR